MEQLHIFKDIFLILLSAAVGIVVSYHVTKSKDRKEYDKNIEAKFAEAKKDAKADYDTIDENFDKLWKRIEMIITALMNSNGAGVKFAEAYEKELKRSEQESQFKMK